MSGQGVSGGAMAFSAGLLIWIKVGQGPTALAGGTGGRLNIFHCLSFLSFFLPLSGRRSDID